VTGSRLDFSSDLSALSMISKVELTHFVFFHGGYSRVRSRNDMERLMGTEIQRVESVWPRHLRGWGAVEGVGATGNAKYNAARLFGKQAAVTVVP
jgi:hypothetical protein